ncbi:MAG: DNA mismatch repair protein, partial [Saprospiraceae bacterium]|nr:DNA mismatch repair protein [Saprospiraceae bacterium]
MLEYEKLVDYYGNKFQELTRIYNRISFGRLLVAVVMVYLFYYAFSNTTSYLPVIFLGLAVVLFIVLLRWHNRVSSDRRMVKSLLQINQNEIAFLQGNNPFDNGAEYIDHQHLYTFDLDIFGAHSLFQYLNRTGTFLGYDRLAKRLRQPLSREEIFLNQQAVSELKPLLSLRQKINALVVQYRDSKEVYRHLENWQKSSPSFSQVVAVFMYLLPMLLFSLILVFAFTLQPQFLNYIALVFIINLVLLGRFSKQIKRELYGA